MVLDTNGRFALTTRDDLKRAFQDYRAQLGKADVRLAVFFHGGLVAIPDGLATASLLVKAYEGPTVWPFFPIWDSGPLDVLTQHWVTILESALFRTIFGHVCEAALAPDSRTSIHRLLDLARNGVGGQAAANLIKTQFTPTDRDALTTAIDNDPIVRATLANLRAKAARSEPRSSPSREQKAASRSLPISIQTLSCP